RGSVAGMGFPVAARLVDRELRHPPARRDSGLVPGNVALVSDARSQPAGRLVVVGRGNMAGVFSAASEGTESPVVSRLSLVIRVLIGLGVTYGCHAMPARAAAAGIAVHDQCGVVFIIGGVGGMDLLGPAAQWALPRAGIRHEVRDFVW